MIARQKMDVIFHRRHWLDLLVDRIVAPAQFSRARQQQAMPWPVCGKLLKATYEKRDVFARLGIRNRKEKRDRRESGTSAENARRFSGSICGWKTASAASGLYRGLFQGKMVVAQSSSRIFVDAEDPQRCGSSKARVVSRTSRLYASGGSRRD